MTFYFKTKTSCCDESGASRPDSDNGGQPVRRTALDRYREGFAFDHVEKTQRRKVTAAAAPVATALTAINNLIASNESHRHRFPFALKSYHHIME
jgi:hypothetical protein